MGSGLAALNMHRPPGRPQTWECWSPKARKKFSCVFESPSNLPGHCHFIEKETEGLRDGLQATREAPPPETGPAESPQHCHMTATPPLELGLSCTRCNTSPLG